MSQLTKNFVTQEFVPPEVFNIYGDRSVWFIDYRVPAFAQFLKEFFTEYYQNKFPGKVKTVLIRINNWHTGGDRKYSGFRPRSCNVGEDLSQHRFGRAIDTEIIIVFNDGSVQEADYKEIHQVVQDNVFTFMKYGLGAVEDISIAKGWMHWDMRQLSAQGLLVVKP